MTYGPYTIGGPNDGVMLQGVITIPLDTTNSNIVLTVKHNSSQSENVIGPVTGPFFGSPQNHLSYMQIKKVG